MGGPGGPMGGPMGPGGPMGGVLLPLAPHAPPTGPGGMQRAGYLKKEGGKGTYHVNTTPHPGVKKHTDRRFIVVQPGALAYYKSDKDAAKGLPAKGQVLLAGASVRPDPWEKNGWVVQTTVRTYKFAADNPQMQQQWIQWVAEVISQAPGPGPGGPMMGGPPGPGGMGPPGPGGMGPPGPGGMGPPGPGGPPGGPGGPGGPPPPQAEDSGSSASASEGEKQESGEEEEAPASDGGGKAASGSGGSDGGEAIQELDPHRHKEFWSKLPDNEQDFQPIPPEVAAERFKVNMMFKDAQKLIPILRENAAAHFTKKAETNLRMAVLLGDQSTGKSTALENIINVKCALKGGGMCTKRPIVYEMIENPDMPELLIEIRPESGGEYEKTTLEELDMKLAARQKITPEEIFVRISGPGTNTLTIVDLPGIIRLDEKYGPEISGMCERYISRPDALVMLCRSSDSDWIATPSNAYKMVRRVDPKLSRVMWVNTKFGPKLSQLDSPRLIEDYLTANGKYLNVPLFFFDVKKDHRGQPTMDLDPEVARFEVAEMQQELLTRMGMVDSSAASRFQHMIGAPRIAMYIQQVIAGNFLNHARRDLMAISKAADELDDMIAGFQAQMEPKDWLSQAQIGTSGFVKVVQESLYGRALGDKKREGSFGFTLEEERTHTKPDKHVHWTRYEYVVRRENERLYGGAMYARFIDSELMQGVRCISLPDFSTREMTVVLGAERFWQGATVMHKAMKLAHDKTRTLFTPSMRYIIARVKFQFQSLFEPTLLLMDEEIQLQKDSISEVGTEHRLSNIHHEFPEFRKQLRKCYYQFLDKYQKECEIIGDYLVRSNAFDYSDDIERLTQDVNMLPMEMLGGDPSETEEMKRSRMLTLKLLESNRDSFGPDMILLLNTVFKAEIGKSLPSFMHSAMQLTPEHLAKMFPDKSRQIAPKKAKAEKQLDQLVELRARMDQAIRNAEDLEAVGPD